MLYFRMMVLMIISFYTSRVVLHALGVEDYGIYNVVGGSVAMLAFINSSMTLASNRFLSFAIGNGNQSLLQDTYHTSLLIHFIIAGILVILAETLGLWLFYNFLNIPAASRPVAMFVYQVSVVGSCLSICIVPFTALVIAHEDMDAFACISLLEGGLKLTVAFLITIPFMGGLRWYSLLMLAVTLCTAVFWRLYTLKKYPYCKPGFQIHKLLLREMFGFVSWQLVGSLSWMLRSAGANLVLNHFFGPILNTARSISLQVNGGVTSLVSNFQTASSPQMVKYFAKEQQEQFRLLLFRSSKMSFLLVAIFAIPILFNVDALLSFWLGEIPPYALVFVRLSLIAVMADSLSGTLNQAAQATGRIREYTLTVTTVLLSYILFVYMAFAMDCPPYTMILVEIGIYIIAFAARLVMSRLLVDIKAISFLRRVTFREVATAIISICLISVLERFVLPNDIPFIINLIVAFAIVVLSCWLVGLDKFERIWIIDLLKSKFHRSHV